MTPTHRNLKTFGHIPLGTPGRVVHRYHGLETCDWQCTIDGVDYLVLCWDAELEAIAEEVPQC